MKLARCAHVCKLVQLVQYRYVQQPLMQPNGEPASVLVLDGDCFRWQPARTFVSWSELPRQQQQEGLMLTLSQLN